MPAPIGIPGRLRRWPWAALLGLHALLFAGAATFDRRAWPSPIGDEATYAMQAQSLAFDGDLLYERRDFDRYLAGWGHPPVGLILQSGDDGARITFGKPVFYAVFLAPFVRALPRQGPFVANALLLLVASVVAARALGQRLGPLAPLWVSIAVFASIAFAFVFWVHADLFLLCLLAFALAVFVRGDADAAPAIASWAAAGAFLAVLAFSRPFYLGLFLPALVAAHGRRRALAALLAGALLVVVVAGGAHRALAGSWTGYGASRAGFYPHTGFPEVDFPAADWRERLATTTGEHAWRPETAGEKRIIPSLWAWNAVYFLAGRQVGVLPYFLPLVVGIAGLLRKGAPRGAAPEAAPASAGVRWSLVLAVALAVAAFFWWRPFNFYGGGGTIGNRYFLPLYAVFWFLPARRLRLGPLLAIPLLAAPFLADLWRHPRAYPIGDDGAYRYVTAASRRLLPYETTQSHLQLAGREDLYAGVFLRFLSPGLATTGDGVLTAPAAHREELLLGSADGLATVDLVGNAESVEVDGKRVELLPPAAGDPEGTRRFRVHLGRSTARHPLWWTWQPVDLWVLRLRFTADATAVTFRVELPSDLPLSRQVYRPGT